MEFGKVVTRGEAGNPLVQKVQGPYSLFILAKQLVSTLRVLGLGLWWAFASRPSPGLRYPWAWISPSPNAIIVKEESPGNQILVDRM
jgi:hypothetical protein